MSTEVQNESQNLFAGDKVFTEAQHLTPGSMTTPSIGF